MQNCFPSHLADDELVLEVERLARSARETTAALVAHLAEFDERRLHRGLGYRSLFAYCTERLRISEYGAYNRMEAARAARRFPVILGMLSDGSLTLATARILAPHLTAENHRELLEASRGRSKRGVEELVARCSPRPEVATLVRRLPRRSETAGCALATPESESPTSDIPPTAEAVSPEAPDASTGTIDGRCMTSGLAVAVGTGPADGGDSWWLTAPARSTRPAVTPLAPERYQIRFTATAETYQKLRQAQDLLGHSVPNGDVATVFDRALSALLAELTRKKFGATKRPKAARASSTTSEGSRHVPADVRRLVWQRDEGQCAFTAASGLRCSARKALEFHHVHPYGAGGEATVGNIELRCRSHNAYEAEVFYGGTPNNRGMQTRTASSGGATRPGASSQGRGQTLPESQRAAGTS